MGVSRGEKHPAKLVTFGSLDSSESKWKGGVLAADGRIYCIPSDATSVLCIESPFDPRTEPKKTFTSTFGELAEGPAKWEGGVLGKDGKIYGIPYNSTQILCIDPKHKTATTFGRLSPNTCKYRSGAVAEDGRIYCAPYSADTVLCIDPIERTVTEFGGEACGTGLLKYS